MSDKRVIYRNDDGGISVIIPADCGLSIAEIADKDVPAGKPYKIIDVSDVPDRSDRGDWDVSDDDLTDGVGRGV